MLHKSGTTARFIQFPEIDGAARSWQLVYEEELSEDIAVELIEWKVFWVVESDNCLARSKLYI